ncbi:hybrid non-ribosomal peptide synthetase/type I polyketide synthase [Vibrio vulnificus]|uniref:hybrid non-ribosomal peptide synthetase/type I polyketide synthase n=1 Tax=Marinagarivorans algicola TaxID=1513270 RepID=UPI0006B55222|nr:hybrid non-ribosomal peptide synthetase/type I polyketide synthase [Marinagarivorans algicola]EGQ9933738.1 hybrid non-ribosomal peptide synthetase/type I polyketide synthase [Vibrio vulnificus]
MLSRLNRLAVLLRTDTDELVKNITRLVSSFGFDSVDLARLRQNLEPKPSFQELYGLPLKNVLERLIIIEDDSSKAEATSDVLISPVLDIQQSYLMGSDEGCPCVVYQEFKVDGLNLDVFWQALDQVVLNEPMCHAAIEGGTQQTVKPRSDWQSVSHLVADVENFAVYRETILNEFHRNGNYWYVAVARSGSEVRLLLIVNMLFMDATSVVELCNRVSRCYQERLAGRTSEVQVEPATFLEFAKIRTKRQPSDDVIAQWQERLASFPKAPQLPRRKHDDKNAASFARVSRELHVTEWASLKQLAQDNGITSSALLIAVFSDVVRLYSENSDFTLTITRSDRPADVSYDHAVGEFTNVVLCPVIGVEPLLTRATQVQNELNLAFEQDDLTGLDTVRLLREVQKDPHIGFPIVFTSFLGITDRLEGFDGVNFSLVHQQTQTPQLSLDHQVLEINGRLHINWDFDTSIFDGALMQQMLDCFWRTLQQGAQHLPMVATLDEATMQLRKQSNTTQKEFAKDSPVPKLLHEMVLQQVSENPAKVAVIDQDIQMTYQQLSDYAQAIAQLLTQRGVRAEEPVAIVQEKGWEQVASAIGILMAGASYLPLNPSHPDDRIRNIIHMAGCRFALVQAKTLIDNEQPRSWHRQEQQYLVELMVVDTTLTPTGDWSALDIGEDRLAYIIFTSGSTGTPKGVEIDHRGAVNTCLDINDRFAPGQDTVTFGISSLGFDLSVWDIFGTLGAGGTLVMCGPNSTIDPDYWWQQVLAHQVTVWNTVPTSFEMLVHSRPEEVEMPIQSVLLSGDAISINLVSEASRVFPNLQIHALGGATEASIWSNYHTVKADTFLMGTDLVPYGKPLSNQTMMVLDEQLRYRPCGVVGDIYIGGIGVAKGYFGQSELTAEKFIDSGEFGRIYQTGDLGRYLANGEIEIIGRKDSQVKVGGHRVELSEIERCAERLDDVARAAVVHIPGAGSRVVGFYTGAAAKQQVRRYVEEHLPDYMAPNTWIQLETIPLTANSKVDMKQLRLIAQASGNESHEIESIYIQDVKTILGLAAEVLNVPANVLSPTQSLAEQGLTSLYAVQLVNRLNQAYQTKLSYTLLFNYPTANKLAAYLVQGLATSPKQVSKPANRSNEPIAIIATSCRLPGGVTSSDEFFHQLLRSDDVFTEIPKSRFDIDQIYSPSIGEGGGSYVRRGAFIGDITGFDHDLFGISRAEAYYMDPQQRHMMEVTYEAIVNAGYTVEELTGSDTGVFIGQMNYDWMMDFDYSREYASTGSAPSITSNRLSYVFDWQGPSMTVDTACSSSLVAVDMAVERLRKGDCSLAVAGGVNLILSPEPYVFTCQSRMLSPNERCATFDEQADGIIRGEGVGAVLLKRLSDAEADGDPILAIIRGSAVNQDGRSASLTAPNGLAQQAVYRAALADAELKGSDVDYLECHGTGTTLGDPIEVESIRTVMAEQREQPIILGALKTNLGHLEGAAGITGLIKAIEVMRHRVVPPNRHFQRLNPKIQLTDSEAKIPTEVTALGSVGTLTGAVSSFGYGGTNAHLILQSYEGSERIMKNPTVWMFSGQGSLLPGSVNALYQKNDTFRLALTEYLSVAEAHIDAKHLRGSLLEMILTPSDAAKRAMIQTQLQQPALVAVQLAQVAMWEQRGLHPKTVLGHSIGELSAAVVLGVLSAEDAIQLAAKRGALMGDCPPGHMAAINERFEVLQFKLPAHASISAVNAYQQTVIASADKSALNLNGEYEGKVFHLPVSHAFHSPMMAPAAEEFAEVLTSYTLREPRTDIDFISTLSVEKEAHELRSAEYWANQMVSTVQFLDAVKALKLQLKGNEAIIEFGASPTLLNLSRVLLEDQKRVCYLNSIDTADGVPSIVPLAPATLGWPALNAKKPLHKPVSASFSSTSSSLAPLPEWVRRPRWINISTPTPASDSDVLVISPMDIHDLPMGWSHGRIDGFAEIATLLNGRSGLPLAYVCGLGSNDVYYLLQLLQEIVHTQIPSRLVVVIPDSLPEAAGVRGLARAAECEMGLMVQVVSTDSELPAVAIRGALSLTQPELRSAQQKWFEVQYETLDQVNDSPRALSSSLMYVITGGLGDLGLRAVRILHRCGARNLLLLGRKTQAQVEPRFTALQSELPDAKVRYVSLDVTDASAMRAFAATLTGGVAGIIHTAGVIDDGLISHQTVARTRRVIAAKVDAGRLLLDELQPSEFMVAYSSIVARLGSVGQSSYCAANSALDGLVEEYASQPVTSIQWGAWSETGMAYRVGLVDKLADEGFGIVEPEQGDQILTHVLLNGVRGIISVSPIESEKRPSSLTRRENSVNVATPNVPTSQWSRTSVLNTVTESLSVFVSGEIDAQMGFMEAGLSSLDLVQFRQALLNALPDTVNIPTQFVFNYPTVEDVVEHLALQLAQVGFDESETDMPQLSYVWQSLNDVTEGEPLFLVGGVMGNIEKTFGPLAAELNVPVYGVMPEIPWELQGRSLSDFAAELLGTLEQQCLYPRFWLGGLSFGATLAIEMGLQLERRRPDALAGLILLDPRHLAPFTAPEDAAPFERLVEGHHYQALVKAPAYWYRSTIPDWDKQSDMMKEASRSFQSDADIEQRCRATLENLLPRHVEGHHFNFLYRFREALAAQIHTDMRPQMEEVNEPIAIVSAACRLPGGVHSREQFWTMLEACEDCISEIPLTRFDVDSIYDANPDARGKSYTRVGGFIDSAESFDHRLFGLSEAEAEVMDPQQRVLLEVVHQALTEAGVDRSDLKGTDTAVFVGLANDDWSSMGRDHEAHNPYFGAGVSSSIMSNRISYLYGLNGPSMTVDTACSSSLVAVDLAVEKLRRGVCSMAIVGGVNIIASPRMYVSACATKALSPQGRCASFDADADGYCRGEGAGAVILKRLRDARQAGDPILAVVRGTAVNQDGKSVSMTAPNGRAQEAVIAEALKNAHVEPKNVDYVECHGTGTPLGDPIEIASLQNVLAKERNTPLVVGSVKSNIGHLEGAAGIVGLIKTVEVLLHRRAPGLVHFKRLNPNISTHPMVLVGAETQLLKPHGELIAGVSSFGFGGTNAHVVLSSYEQPVLNEAKPTVAFQRTAFPWRRLANPLLSRTIDGYLGASLNGPLAQLWKDHAIEGMSLVPAASHLTMMAGLELTHGGDHSSVVCIRDVVFTSPAILSEHEAIRCVQQDTFTCIEVGRSSQWQMVAQSQTARAEPVMNAATMPDLVEVQARTERVRYEDKIRAVGERIDFGPGYQRLDELWLNDREGLAKVSVSGLQPIEWTLTLLAPPVLDAGLQLLGLPHLEQTGLCVPFAVDEATFSTLSHQPDSVWLYVEIKAVHQKQVSGDVYIYSEQGQCLAALRGVTCRAWQHQNPLARHLYDTHWKATPMPLKTTSGVLLSSSVNDLSGLASGWSGYEIHQMESLPEWWSPSVERIVWIADETNIETTLTWLQWFNDRQPSTPLAILVPTEHPEPSPIIALVRSVRLENPSLDLRCLQGPRKDIVHVAQTRDIWGPDEDYRWQAGQGSVIRLSNAVVPDLEAIAVQANRTYVVSGGHGALGEVATQYLLAQGATHVVRLSRQSLPSLETNSAVQVITRQCDVSSAQEVQALYSWLQQAQWPTVAGVIHTAGVLADATLANQSMEKFRTAAAAKVQGAVHLREYLAPTDFMLLYSSAASVFGAPGQSSYVYANAQLDSLARQWQSGRARVLSIQWGPWSEAGMAARHGALERAQLWGYQSIDPAQGTAFIHYLLQRGFNGCVCVCPVDWVQFDSKAPYFEAFTVQDVQATVVDTEAFEQVWSESEIRDGVRRAAVKAMGKHVDDDISLMANGLDSLSGVVLAQELSQMFDLTLGAIFTINHPTIDEMVVELAQKAPTRTMTRMKDTRSAVPLMQAADDLSYSVRSNAREPIAIVSTACRLPGGVCSPQDFWQLLENKSDAISEIPRSRFDIDEVYDPDVNAVGKSYTRKGGFVDGLEYFDHVFFDIPQIEAEAMDPHQRLMLSTGFEAFHQLGYSRSDLKGENIGVFVGVSNQDWMVTQGAEQEHNPYFGPGVSFSIMANRVSYVLGLTGPSMTIDTACSSSLVALDVAVEKLRQHDCDAALVGGVNVMMHARTFIGSCAANMLSPSGRCASFDESADGYCRGEGAGAVVLKRLSDAEASGDPIVAVIHGTAVNQDGASATMTAPNGKAQQAVLRKAYQNAGIDPASVDYVECHGTGTPLGDPIEVDALNKVLGEHRNKPLVLGSAKSNIGHLEGAAGIVGLIKATEVLNRRLAPGICHFQKLNPNINVKDTALHLSAEGMPLNASARLIAGVSSFGFGGTNAHVVLSTHPRGVRQHPSAAAPYQPVYLPWRRLPNPLLSYQTGTGFGARLNGELAALFSDHRFSDQVLVPAASHLTMLAGLRLRTGRRNGEGVAVQQVVFTQPAIVDGSGAEIRCVQSSGLSIELAQEDQWYRVAEAGRCVDLMHPAAFEHDVEEVIKRCTEVPYHDRLAALGTLGAQFGAGYQNIHQLYVGSREGVANVKVALNATTLSLALIAPATLDAGIQLLGLLSEQDDRLLVPYRVAEARFYVVSKQPTELFAYARVSDVHAQGLVGDVWLFLADGQCLAHLQGLECRQFRPEGDVLNHLYKVTQQPANAPVIDLKVSTGVLVTAQSESTLQLPFGWQMISRKTWTLAPSVQASNSSQLIWDARDLASAADALSLLQSVFSHPAIPSVILVLSEGSDWTAYVQALCQSALLEHPDRSIQCVVLTSSEALARLFEHPLPGDEPVVRANEQGWNVDRLMPASLPRSAQQAVRTSATYIISGGLGALGLATANWLISQGATHLLLVGRSVQLSAAVAEQLKVLQGKAQVAYVACDISQRAGLQSAIQPTLAHWPEVAGVFHTAGVLTDAILTNQTPSMLAQSMAVKVVGAEHLFEICQPSDVMMMFSSASAVFGSLGQSSYAASNALMDTLVKRWSGRGVQVVSVQWGAWSDTGMAVRSGAAARSIDAGFGSISTAQGLQVLDRILRSGQSGVWCYCPFDWSRVMLTSPLIEAFKPVERVSPTENRQETTVATISEIELKLIVRSAVRKALGQDVSDDDPLMAKGLDSLNGVALAQEIGRSVGLSLGAIFTINHPSINDMVAELLTLAPQRITTVEQPVPSRAAVSTLATTSVELPSNGNHDIAVVSVACKLPGAVEDTDELWQMLLTKPELMREVPKHRFDLDPFYDPDPAVLGKTYTKHGSFLDDVDAFDHEFFNIPVVEARAMDPQQRLLLEVACEAFYRAGYDMDSLKSQDIGVFVGQMSHDWAHMHGDRLLHDPYFGAGSAASITSNRISYLFGLSGPSMTLDTACSSSLVALDLAVNKLRQRDCSAALVGGVNLMLSHRSFIGCCAANMLSHAGRCASFDASADGYSRGEGVGAVVLKRLSDAEACGDDILAVIKGTAVNQDGRSASLTAPNGKAQQQVIQRALDDAGYRGRDLDFVECHGTGTPLGDPIEIDALQRVTGEGREKPLAVGTIKSNIGHLEGAAGIIGFIKAVESVRRRQVPGLAHFEMLNPKIDLTGSKLIIGSEATALSTGKVIGGVSSFGFGGTNAHVVLESYGEASTNPESPASRSSNEGVSMLFTGQGALQSGVLKALYSADAVFRDALQNYTSKLQSYGIDLLPALLEPSDEHTRFLTPTRTQQPALVAMQLAMLEMWQNRGIRPATVLGHSVGEFAAAVAAGVMSPDQALELAVVRGQAMMDCEPGSMAALMVARSELEPLPEGIVCAAENGPKLTIVAGAKETLIPWLQQHHAGGFIELPVSHAFHSPMMDPAQDKLRQHLSSHSLHTPTDVKFISTLTGQAEAEALTDADYWGEQMVQSVKYLAAVRALFESTEQPTTVIELGPGNTLIKMAQRIVDGAHPQWIESVDPTVHQIKGIIHV